MTWRLRGFTIRGFGPFDREYSVDLDALGPDAKVVAICGENGAGKTTVVELASSGAMYRETPTRGSLVDLATASDAFLESRFVNGSAWTVRHLVNGVSRKSEALVLDENDQPVLPDSKVSSFDAWAAQHLPSQQVFFATALTPQGAGGFAGCKATARKDILLTILGPEVQRLETFAQHCREQLKAAKSTLDRLEARIADEEHRGGDAEALSAELVSRRQAVEAWTVKLAGARDALAQAEAQARAREAALEAEQRRQADLAKAQQELSAARAALATLEAKVAANQNDLLGNAEAIRAAAERLPALLTEQAGKRAEVAAADARANQHATATVQAARDQAAATNRLEAATARVAKAQDARDRIGKLDDLRQALAAAERLLDADRETLERLRSRRLAGAEERLGLALDTLTTIAGGEDDPQGLAQDRLEQDARQVQEATELPGAIVACEQAYLEHEQELATHQRQVRNCELYAEIAAGLDPATLEAADAQTDVDTADARRIEEGRLCEAAHADRKQLDEALAALVAERERVEPFAGKLPHLDKAEARLAELRPLVAAGKADVLRLERALADVKEPVQLPAPIDLAFLRRDVEQLEGELASCHRAVAQTEERLAQAVASRARVLELTEQRVAAETEVADWSRLAGDLGRDGLQAMVIDQAIPEINDVCNSLLHAAFGTRFTVEVRTQTADSKGKRMLETLDVWVIDTGTEQHRGREGLYETFSGGEKTILAEALSLALTQLACRLAGAERPTLIRDESAGQLSQGNAPLWVAMMRRAADLMNVDRILFINQDRQTWDLADAQIHVGAA